MQSNDVALLGQSVEQLVRTLPERISSPLFRWQEQRPDAVAVRDHLGQVCTFAQLAERVRHCQQEFREWGVRPGDRVLLINENCVALAVCILALSELDAVSVVVNARLAAPEIARISTHCEPRLTVCFLDSSAAQAHWQALLQQTGACEIDQYGARLGMIPGYADPVTGSDGTERVSVMIYTTGTTGDPKGVMLTHRNILFVSAVTSVLRGMSAQDRIYAVLPISHVFGLSAVLLASLYVGAELVLADRFDASRTLQTFAEHHITGMFGVPTMFAKLIEYTRAQGIGAAEMPRLRFIYSGGSPLDPTIKLETEKLFGLTLLNAYGMTESGPTICQVRYNEKLDNCSVGRPLPGMEIRVLDSEGREVVQGEVGELHVRGPNIMTGYFRNPQATQAVIDAEGFLNTGDLVRLDESGNVHIAGRSKELIIHSGFNVYPPEVEAVIARHPDVVLCAVLGEAVDGNENVLAFVQTIAGSTLDEVGLQAFLKPLLTPYKRPARIMFLEQLPTAPSGKVLKHQLKRFSQSTAQQQQ
ncbi:MAG: class I adenylate-forming enzyme family protein [Gammaproteobacteria bacterium]|nr:class I adenylate-forming enzyme family protein [Gammaproteobacteria bacterium]MDP2140820.1 class I adenylate-forming enzyme family protein [Gammaproteobacteria bacterium]MDP2347566.1 class I adenylate-forming enzyme family protein [Gammaproteobacteria bacterium]